MPSILLWFLNIQKNYVKGKTVLAERHYGRFSYQKSLCQDCRLAAGDTPTEKVWLRPWGHSLILPAGKKKNPYRCPFPY